jgi:hypothetical protein
LKEEKMSNDDDREERELPGFNWRGYEFPPFKMYFHSFKGWQGNTECEELECIVQAEEVRPGVTLYWAKVLHLDGSTTGSWKDDPVRAVDSLAKEFVRIHEIKEVFRKKGAWLLQREND